MATYLQLVNRVLRRMNEVEVSTVTGHRGFTAAVTDFVNDAVRDVYNAELKWPFNHADGTTTIIPGVMEYALPSNTSVVSQDSFVATPPNLITNGTFDTNISGWTDISSGSGTISWVSTGNGRMLINAGVAGTAGASQPIVTVVGQRYAVEVHTYGGNVTLGIGTALGLEDVQSFTLSPEALDRGAFFRKEFVATATNTYITIKHTTNSDHYLDFITVTDVSLSNRKLVFKPYNIYLRDYKERELDRSVVELGEPMYVTLTDKNTYIVWPKPKWEYVVIYEYWTVPNDLSNDIDTPTIPERYTYVIMEYALYYCHHFREDFEQAAIKLEKAKKGIERMRTELINRPEYFQGSGHI